MADIGADARLRIPISVYALLIHRGPSAMCVPRYRGDHLDARALIRLQADTVNRALVPAFYRYLQAQDVGA